MNGKDIILDLEQLIAAHTAVLEHLLYLVWQGKVLTGPSSLLLSGITVDSHVHMCAWVLGGAGGGRVPIQGEWNCRIQRIFLEASLYKNDEDYFCLS